MSVYRSSATGEPLLGFNDAFVDRADIVYQARAMLAALSDEEALEFVQALVGDGFEVRVKEDKSDG